jgi:FMN-dependent NADH-azoreductase
MQILRIDTATTGQASVSRKLTQAIMEHLRARHPGAKIIERDFGTDPLPHLTEATTGAIRRPADQQDEPMRAAFAAERAVLDEFLASDIVVLGAPMYNFTIPSSLKAWIDRLGVPGVTFSYSEAGPKGLAGGRKVVIASSRGGSYEMDGPFEHQETYLRDVLAFIGIDDPVFIRAEKTGFGPEAVSAALAEAQKEIEQL